MHHWLAYPTALLLLAALPVLAAASWWARWRRRRALARLGAPGAAGGLAARLLGLRSVRGLASSAALTLLAVGVAGPRWGRDPAPALAPGRDIVAVLDVSRSMLAEDVLGKSAPNRLGRARDALDDLAHAVQARGGHRLALVVFAARPWVLCPLTHDYDHFRSALAALDPADLRPQTGPAPGEGAEAASGTRIGRALQAAVKLQDDRFRSHQDILLLSDGDDPAADREWQAGVTAAQQAGIPVHAVGVGNPDRDSPIPAPGGVLRYQGQPVLTRLHEQPLADIARLTGGVFAPAGTRALPLGKLFREYIEPREGREDAEDRPEEPQSHYALFFAPALALVAAVMALGWPARRRRAAPVPAAATPLLRAAAVFLAVLVVSARQADDPEAVLRQGNEAFARGDYAGAVARYEQAETRTTDPGLVAFNEAAALYRLGRYRDAERHYLRCLEDAEGLRRPRAFYDLGNAVLRQADGRDARLLDRAIGFYEDCLRLAEPDTNLAADARFNLDLARALRQKVQAGKEQPEEDRQQGEHNPRPQGDAEDPDRGNDPRQRLGPTGDSEPAAGRPAGQAQDPVETTQPPPPGMNPNLPPVPDAEKLVPLSRDETLDYLRRAAARIARERREHRARSAPAVPPDVKDW